MSKEIEICDVDLCEFHKDGPAKDYIEKLLRLLATIPDEFQESAKIKFFVGWESDARMYITYEEEG